VLGQPSLAIWAVTVATAWKGFPLVFIIVLSALQSLDPQYLEAAKVDGALWPSQLRHVILPHLRSSIALAAVLRSPLCGISDDALLALRCAPLLSEADQTPGFSATRPLYTALRRHDEIGPLGDCLRRNVPGIFEDVDRKTGALRREGQPVVRGRRNDTCNICPIVAQRFEYRGAEKTRPDQRALHG